MGRIRRSAVGALMTAVLLTGCVQAPDEASVGYTPTDELVSTLASSAVASTPNPVPPPIPADTAAPTSTGAASSTEAVTSAMGTTSGPTAPGEVTSVTAAIDTARAALGTVFDPATTEWFAATCTAMNAYDDLVDSLTLLTGEVADDPVATRDIALGGLQPLAGIFTDFADALRSIDPPALTNGESAHSAVIESFDGLGNALLAAVDELERLDTSSVDAVLEAMSTIGENLQETVGLSNPRAEVRRLGPPDPDQLAVVSTVIGCRTQQFG